MTQDLVMSDAVKADTEFPRISHEQRVYGGAAGRADLEGHIILELIQKHLQLAHADHKVRQAKLVLHIPPQRPKLQSLLQVTRLGQ